MKILSLLVLLSATVWAQVPSDQAQNPAAMSSPAPDFQELNSVLSQVQSFSEKTDRDLSRLRIDKWKTDGQGKQQGQASADSIRRNLTNAIPDLLQRVRTAPNGLNSNFRLYRNLNALYDALASLAETAGAFGPKDQYDPVAQDVSELDHLRHTVADRVDQLAGTNDAELARVRSQLQAAQAAKPAASPAKVVVDDNAPAKTTKKKKSSAAGTKSTTTTSTPATKQ